MRSKKSKGFSCRNRKFKQFFRPKAGDLQKKKVFTEIARDFTAEIGNSSSFSGQKQVISEKKIKKGLHWNCKGFSGWNRKFKRFFLPKTGDLQKKRSSSIKNTNLDLDLRSRSPEPVNFFGAQSSLGAQFSFGGAQAVSWGGTAPVCPPVAPGLYCYFCQLLALLNISLSVETASGSQCNSLFF